MIKKVLEEFRIKKTEELEWKLRFLTAKNRLLNIRVIIKKKKKQDKLQEKSWEK